MNSEALHADVFRAISDPTRRRLLDVLATGEQAVRELLAHFKISQPAVSQHLKVLKDAGIIAGRIEGPAVCYCLAPGALASFGEAVTLLAADAEKEDGQLVEIVGTNEREDGNGNVTPGQS